MFEDTRAHATVKCTTGDLAVLAKTAKEKLVRGMPRKPTF
jgi:hypothetical protein